MRNESATMNAMKTCRICRRCWCCCNVYKYIVLLHGVVAEALNPLSMMKRFRVQLLAAATSFGFGEPVPKH